MVSVRWDEAGLKSVMERQRRERQTRRESVEALSKTARDGKDTGRKSSDSGGRRRVAIADIFPEIREQSFSSETVASSETVQPVVTVEEPSVGSETPRASAQVKKVRPRPVSDQTHGKVRPKPMADDGDGES